MSTTHFAEFENDLRVHSHLCEEILRMAENESSILRGEEDPFKKEKTEAKKNFLALLAQSLDKLREHRVAWLKLEPAVRQKYPGIIELLRENQNLIMKILVIDRENESTLLRKGLVPTRHLPSANRQRPHYVADLYRRNSYA